MKGQMVAVDQAANIGIQFQGERKARQDPPSSSGRYRRSAHRQMQQAKPAMLTEVDMRASMSKSWAAPARRYAFWLSGLFIILRVLPPSFDLFTSSRLTKACPRCCRSPGSGAYRGFFTGVPQDDTLSHVHRHGEERFFREC